ncbi:UPF0705 protein C11orf49 [Caerostris darwini]|uniref:Centriolar satellite-associated tubulin polyglutamylase complex regulator 1 n=1 Tax=Caerostris darwini TaxID=1538125 RepID=A0AAV4NUM3_9ARAC|nr:UPF0705 protein C11orf49 [Caerostris darwini]
MEMYSRVYKIDESRAATEKMENDLYLENHNLQVYLDDAVTQMLSLRLENQANKTKPAKFFKEYFSSVHQGTHILFREFSFISATPYNRLCVIKAIMQIFKPLLYIDRKLNAKDYHSLLQLIWPNIPFEVVQTTFINFETPEQKEEVRLSYLEFLKAMKNSFCVGKFDFEAKIVNCQVEKKYEEFSNTLKERQKATSFRLGAEFLHSLEESGSDEALLWPATSNLVQNTEFKRKLDLKESNSFSSDEPVEGMCGKLSRSSSGSKDASKSDQNVSTFSRASSASLQGRLSGKQLSNSLTLLQTEKIDTENNFSTCRHRSKSAVAIQRNLHSRF